MTLSLRTRLIFSHILPILVIIPVIGGILVYMLETQFLLTNISSELTNQAVLVADVASLYREIWSDPQRAQNFVSEISPGVTAKVTLLDPTGRLLVSSDPTDDAHVGELFSQASIQKIYRYGISADVTYRNNEITEVVVPVITQDRRLLGFVRIVNPLADISARSQSLRALTLGVLGGGLLLGVILGLILATDIARPLRRVTQAVNRISEGKPSEPIKEVGPREIRLLVHNVNGLVEQLHVMEESRRRLLSNLVHEIGTPLGALRSGAQALLSGADEDPELRKELIHGMDDELGRLQNLVDDLAHLHDQILGPLDLNIVPVQITEWFSRIVIPWEKAAVDKNLRWNCQIPSNPVTVEIDPDRMAQAVNNLVSNAIRYTPPGGEIWISLNQTESEVILEVKDNGPGIQAEEQKRIFSPLYRGKTANRFSSGMGLGLSIAKDLVEAHGGRLIVESQVGQGSSFTIHLPKTGQLP
ncbi:MAG TPA: HAMP domain-containing sensor histidine kinase [Anaerolineaceae bacterium]|nr:HAMP domain-containing sensor histidine kinase [Anaerolineaceae bacterium]